MARATVHHVKKARNNNKELGIKKGQEYWWWKFRYGGKQISLTDPGVEVMYRLTEFQQNEKDYTDRKEELENNFDDDEKQSLLSDIEEYKSELEDKLSNMPDQLQESHQLNDQIQTMQDLYDEVESIEGDDE